MRAVELFAGVGGFRLGLERNNISVVYANEWDKYAADTYDKNFRDGIDRRSITDVRADEIPEHDIICGGFPCQAFSIAGKRRGFDETRGTLFFDIMRIAQHHRTPYLFLENVKGLLNHDFGRTFEVILKTLDELGYDCQWQVLNSKNFGVPQNRERIFIIGHLRGQPRPEVFPLGETKQQANEPSRDGKSGAQAIATRHLGRNGKLTSDIAHTLQSSDIPGVIQLNQPTHSNDRVYHAEGVSPTLNTMQGGNRQPFVMGTINKGQFKKTENALTIGATYHKGHDNHGARPMVMDGRIRRLTPLECERLQGFPDGWTEGMSDTQRYKQMGNAVTVNVIEAIAGRLANVGR